jgi:hypothetical protein
LFSTDDSWQYCLSKADTSLGAKSSADDVYFSPSYKGKTLLSKRKILTKMYKDMFLKEIKFKEILWTLMIYSISAGILKFVD